VEQHRAITLSMPRTARCPAWMHLLSGLVGSVLAWSVWDSEYADPLTRTYALETSGTPAGATVSRHGWSLLVVVDLRRPGHLSGRPRRYARGPPTNAGELARPTLREAPDNLRVEAHASHDGGGGMVAFLREARDTPGLLVADPHRDLRRSQIALTRPLGVNRGRGRGSFIDSVLDAIDIFCGEVMQNLRSWSVTPPRLWEPAELKPPQVLASTALSSQDGAERPGTVARDPAESDSTDREARASILEEPTADPTP
jgi:hypothetical protein